VVLVAVVQVVVPMVALLPLLELPTPEAAAVDTPNQQEQQAAPASS
jgi:hypothetical protein